MGKSSRLCERSFGIRRLADITVLRAGKAAEISALDAANAMNAARSERFELFNQRPKAAV